MYVRITKLKCFRHFRTETLYVIHSESHSSTECSIFTKHSEWMKERKSCTSWKNYLHTLKILVIPDPAYECVSMHAHALKILTCSSLRLNISPLPLAHAFLSQNTETLTVSVPRKMTLISIPSKRANIPTSKTWIQFSLGNLFPSPKKTYTL